MEEIKRRYKRKPKAPSWEGFSSPLTTGVPIPAHSTSSLPKPPLAAGSSHKDYSSSHSSSSLSLEDSRGDSEVLVCNVAALLFWEGKASPPPCEGGLIDYEI